MIESGLDVDHVANDYGYNYEYRDENDDDIMRWAHQFLKSKKRADMIRQALQVVLSSDVDMDFERFRRVTECRKLLLRAGADPTFTIDAISFLDRMIVEGSAVKLTLLRWYRSAQANASVGKHTVGLEY